MIITPEWQFICCHIHARTRAHTQKSDSFIICNWNSAWLTISHSLSLIGCIVWLSLPLLARWCFIVSISTPESLAFLMAEVARGQPDRLQAATTSKLCFRIFFFLWHPH